MNDSRRSSQEPPPYPDVAAPVSAAGRYALLLFMLVYLCAMLDRSILTVLLQPIKIEFHLSDTQLGFISGLGFALALSVAILPIGYLADRVQRRLLLASVVMVWSLLTLACGLAPGFLFLCIARFGVGFAEAGQAPLAISLIGDIFPAHRRATALSLLYMGVPLGALLGLLIAGLVAASHGWRFAMMIAGAPGVLLAIVIGATLREPPRGRQESKVALPPLGIRQSLAAITGSAPLVHLFIAAALSAAVASSMSVWIPSLMMRNFSLGIGTVGPALALSSGICGVLGSLVCGPLVDRLGKGRPARLAALTAFFVIMIFPIAQLCVISHGFALALTFNAIFSFLVPGYLGSLHSTALGLTAARVRGFVFAALGIMLNLLGYGVGPQLVGLTSDWFARRHAAWPLRDAMIVMIFGALWSSAHLLRAAHLLRSGGSSGDDTDKLRRVSVAHSARGEGGYQMDLQLAGKRALVTGSSSGIGRAIAIALAREGAKLIVHGRNRERAESVLRDLGPGAAAVIAIGDLSTDAGAEEVAREAIVAFGGVDILVNNAGSVKAADWERTSIERWTERFNENVLSMVRMILRLAPPMKERGWGRLIQIGSASGTTAMSVAPDYGAGKSAILNISSSLAKQYAEFGITANTVSPGTVLSELITRRFSALSAKTGKPARTERDFYELMLDYDPAIRSPMKRLCRPEEVADLVAFVASPRAGYINGANLRIDGANVVSIN
jgi:NAD(P)-dependent dehydrogenase (short-subunit alcohol dehydrogenase family)/predicted MFS family arabinose efflux permease